MSSIQSVALSPESISALVFEAKGDLSSLSNALQDELKRIGPTIYALSFNKGAASGMCHFEWTAQLVERIVQVFPNLEQLNFDGNAIREIDGFFGALGSLKKLKTISVNNVAFKDRHIENLIRQTAISALSCSISITGIEKKVTAVFPRLVQYDARLEDIIDHTVCIERLADGFEWVEGPIWNKKDEYLLFSDIPRNCIYKWKEGEGVSLFRHASGYKGTTAFTGKEPGSNALTYDAKGQLHVCQHGERRIVRLEPDGKEVVVADRFEGKRLNSPNDLVFKSTGELYFTDPPYGLPLRFDDPEKEIPFSGIYRVKDGVVELMSNELKVPNGLAFSPDEKYLYVSNTGNKALQDAPCWHRFPVKEDGTLGAKETFYEASLFSQRRPGSPDGLKVDEKGNLYCAGPGGVYIFSPDATLLGMIEFAEPTANCNWGGKDGSTLYIASNHAIFAVQMKNKGNMF
jgi:gluconolactonase